MPSASVTPPFRFQNQTTNTRSQGTHIVFDNTWLIGIAAILATGVLLCAVLAVWCYIRPVGNGREQAQDTGNELMMEILLLLVVWITSYLN
jgi:predicted small integral membrane protein